MPREHGITLVELLVTLTVATLLATIALPGFAGLLQEQRLVTATNDLMAGLRLARSEAVQRGEGVLICPSADGIHCQEEAYTVGWIVRLAPESDADVSESGEVLRVYGGPPHAVSIQANGTMSQYIAYRPDGQTRQINGGLQMGTVSLCHGEKGRRIIISRTGRARVEGVDC
ncbi:GspH/FimT family pseudopilin [Ectothiorhodospira marina]|uniref:Type II secretion system protein H n=1 Tax=Ectothiorhodospira marina TaxID=1396821 RepID=A0A1H7K5P4_9GAMM|nr:GspH/FimT family pseudopilin [Ectothiorhodospira marina]SEK81257.1 type IV fimbrial biogenesis protein FimT [Ectothiorhodospira marina]